MMSFGFSTRASITILSVHRDGKRWSGGRRRKRGAEKTRADRSSNDIRASPPDVFLFIGADRFRDKKPSFWLLLLLILLVQFIGWQFATTKIGGAPTKGQQVETADHYEATLEKPYPLTRIHWNDFMTYLAGGGQTQISSLRKSSQKHPARLPGSGEPLESAPPSSTVSGSP